MANDAPYIKWYSGDILTDPKYLVLSRSARLTYRELLDHMWLSGKASLPAEPAKLARILGMTPDQFEADWQELTDQDDPCFQEKDGRIFNKRLSKEWQEIQKVSEQARAAAQARWSRQENRADTCERSADAHADGDADAHAEGGATADAPALPTQCQSESESEPEKKIKSCPDGHDRSRPPQKAPANAPPPCPHDAIIALYHELLPELPPVKVWGPPRQALLRSRWREDKARQNLAWWREYFRQVRGSPFLTGRVKDWRADLEWLVRPKNMPKVLEGHYEQGKTEAAMDPFEAFVAKAEAAK